jgi:predicted nucleic acid-binding protein
VTLRKVVLDTNLYIGWLNEGLYADLFVGPGLVRYLSAIVHMELRVGATMLPARRAMDQLVTTYRTSGRLVVPDIEVFDRAGRTLQRLREKGREIRRASLVSDVLIALSARSIGATVLTIDGDFEAIRGVLDFGLQMVAPAGAER